VTRRHPNADHSPLAATGDDGVPADAPRPSTTGARLLEAEDVADYLGVRTDWVYREVRAGRLPHIRLGRAVRFRRESIEAWIDSRERGVPTRRRP
jgi:excisionase family DNA binding protein